MTETTPIQRLTQTADDSKIAELAQLGVARAYAVEHFNTLSQAIEKMTPEEHAKLAPQQMHQRLVELETARAIMLHSMAQYKAALDKLAPGASEKGV